VPARILTDREVIDFVPEEQAHILCFNTWLIQPREDGEYAPDEIGFSGVSTLVKSVHNLELPIYVFVAGDYTGAYVSRIWAAFNYGRPNANATILQQLSFQPVAASAAGEVHYFAWGIKRLRELGCKGDVINVCGYSHVDQVRTLLEHNMPQEKFSITSYDTGPTGTMYFFVSNILLTLDKTGRLTEWLAHKTGPLKQAIANRALRASVSKSYDY